ncbi:hypothetical protein HK405_006256 [Cladochytrium tenue]|nr:hypothetical protein HK405_006256 [Cladochytrium tenue]
MSTSRRPVFDARGGGAAGGLLLVAAALAVMLVAACLAWWNHAALPAPVGPLGMLVPDFSESNARSHMRALVDDIGFRSPGTVGERLAKEYIVEKLREYQRFALANPSIEKYDISIDSPSGSFQLGILRSEVQKMYVNVSNVAVFISCGRECDENAILVNSHFDSQFGTKGAGDDIVAVSVMLELARIFAVDRTKFRNSLVLLFNGAEETMLDGSHGFITQSELAGTCRAFINMDSMGCTGKATLFQVNSRELAKLYKKVHMPHGTVISNDIFKSGLILSDTDYRQFVGYGGIAGMVKLPTVL